MKVRLKEGGQQLVYEDMCRIANRQAMKKGILTSHKNSDVYTKGKKKDDGTLKPLEDGFRMAHRGGGGGRLTEVIEKLERSVSIIIFEGNLDVELSRCIYEFRV